MKQSASATALQLSPAAKPAVKARAILLLNLDGLVLSANGVAVSTLGMTEQGLLEQPVANLFETNPARLQQYFDRALKGSAVKCQIRLQGRDGQPGRLVSLRIRLHVVGPTCSLEASWETPEVLTDTVSADQEQSEAAARQGAFETLFQAYLELQEVNKQKTNMLAAATHELKTPLAVINGSCELLLGGGLGALSPPQQEIVQLSLQNCRRLLNVVNSFLDYAAVERGKLLLMMAEQDPGEMAADTARYWKKLGHSKGVQFDFAVAHDLPKIRCDRAKLQNVLNSLCDNALKYTPKGGAVILVAEIGRAHV